VFVKVLMLFYGSRAKASPEKSKITITLKRHPMGTTMQHPRLLPLPQRIICAPLCRLSGQREQDEVDHDGQRDAQYHAHQQPEKAPSSHLL